MTEVSEAALDKALKICGINPDQKPLYDWRDGIYARAVGEFARFIQEVSDAAKKALRARGISDISFDDLDELFSPFILPDPVDPLAEALEEAWGSHWAEGGKSLAALRKALARRGIKIVEAKP